MPDSFQTHVLQIVTTEFTRLKRLAERAFAQLEDEDFHRHSPAEGNTIAIIIQHLAGNMHSRWTDFLTTDGEKPDRHRDREFIDGNLDRQALMRRWEEGWEVLFSTLNALVPAELMAIVQIRGESLTVFVALNRQISHYAYHVGQIVLLARQIKGSSWQSLSIPVEQSSSFHR